MYITNTFLYHSSKNSVYQLSSKSKIIVPNTSSRMYISLRQKPYLSNPFTVIVGYSIPLANVAAGIIR